MEINIKISSQGDTYESEDLKGLGDGDTAITSDSGNNLIKLFLRTNLKDGNEIKCESKSNSSSAFPILNSTENNQVLSFESPYPSLKLNNVTELDNQTDIESLETTTTPTESNQIEGEKTTETVTEKTEEASTTTSTTTTKINTITTETTTTETTTTTTIKPCPDGFQLYNDKNNKCYMVSFNESSWDEALVACHSLNATLVSINSLEEFDILIRILMDICEDNIWVLNNTIICLL